MAGRNVFILCAIIAAVIWLFPVNPSPTPPDPDPPVPPSPQEYRVLILHETETDGTLPREQQAIFTSVRVREWLDANVGRENYRIWDDDADTTYESAAWKEALKLPRSKETWLYINGPRPFTGELPASVDALIRVLEQHKP